MTRLRQIWSSSSTQPGTGPSSVQTVSAFSAPVSSTSSRYFVPGETT